MLWKSAPIEQEHEHNILSVLYYQSLPITRYQVRLYANSYFELLPIVSTAFKLQFLNEPG